MTHLFRIINVVIFSSILFCSNAQIKTSTKAAIKDSIIAGLNEVYKQNQFVGFSTAIVNEKGTLFQAGTGYADKATNEPYTANTIQNIGSISKTIIGVALLKAQELGKLKLDDAINKYLPFKVTNPNHPLMEITIRHLATHTSTITDNIYYAKRNYILKPNQNVANVKLSIDDEQTLIPYDSLITLDSYLKNVLSNDGIWYDEKDFLPNKPGELFHYTNVGSALAAYIIEKATGVPFNKFTKKYILKPLKMNTSGWKFDEIDYKKYSKLYYTTDTIFPHYSLITYPDGNFITSSNDLAKYLTELIKGYNGKGTLLSKESYKEYFKAQLNANNYTKRNEKNPYSDEYNIGIFIGQSVAGNYGHTGGDPGVTSILFFNPKNNIGRILIVNTNLNDKKGNKEFYDIWNVLEKYQLKL